MHKIELTKKALKDAQLLVNAKLYNKAAQLLAIIEVDPYQTPPPYEKLKYDLKGSFSRRINDKHCIVYRVLPNTDNLVDNNGNRYKGIIKITDMWNHYDD